MDMDHTHAMPNNKCCIIGSTHFAIECAKILLQRGFLIVHIFSDDLNLRKWAERVGVKFEHSSAIDKKTSSFFCSFDYLFSIVNDKILSKSVLKSVKEKAINYHNGPLPRYAGLNAIHWAIFNGEKEYGISWHEMEKEIDTGNVVMPREVLIEEGDNVFDVQVKCNNAATEALIHLCNKIQQNSVEYIPQDLSRKEYYSMCQRPSPFCFLDIKAETAVNLQNIFRATFTEQQQDNGFGLPKLLLDDDIFVVTKFEITELASPHDHCTVSVKDKSLLLPSRDNVVKVSCLKDLNGIQIALPYSQTLKHLQGKEIHSLNPKLKKLSEAASKYEPEWIKNFNKRITVTVDVQERVAVDIPPLTSIKKNNERVDVPPLTWPYFPYSRSASKASQQPVGILYSVDSCIINKLKEVFPNFSPELIAMSLFTVFLLCLSPTHACSIDVCCVLRGIPNNMQKTLLQYFPVSLSTEKGRSLQQAMNIFLSKLSKTVNGSFDEEAGIRKDIIAADVYLRRSIIKRRNNQILLRLGNSEQGRVRKYHGIEFIFQVQDDSVVINSTVSTNCTSNFQNGCSFVEDFTVFLNAAATCSDTPIEKYPLCSKGMEEDLRKILTGPSIEISDAWLHLRFERIVRSFPYHTAIVDEYSYVTYEEINKRAECIGVNLLDSLKHKNGYQIKVAIALERTWELVACILAVFKIGGCIILIDLKHSKNYIQHIIADCMPDVIVFDTNTSADLIENELNVQLIVSLDDLTVKRVANPLPALPATPSNPAMILYTSGTTGLPKGVILDHCGYCSYLEYAIPILHSRTGHADEFIACFSSVSFDGFFYDVFSALWTGSTLLMCPVSPSNTNRTSHFYSYITVMITQPVKLSLLDPQNFASLQTLGAGGEAITLEALHRWRHQHRKIWNFYGPTETSIATSISDASIKIHIGGIRSNTTYKILNSFQQLLPKGVLGELHIGGVGVARGYTKRDETEKSFSIDKYCMRWYRSGDMVYIDEENDLQIVGRIPSDKQVKIHGFRIELEGIEHVLRQIPEVTYADVCVEEVSTNIQQVVAYTYPPNVSIKYIMEYLKQHLPQYMLPHVIIPLATIDLSVTGKAKRSRKDAQKDERYIAPRGEKESQILEVFHGALGVKTDHMFGMHHGFIEMGGDSVTAIHLASKINSLFSWDIHPSDLFGKLQTPARVISNFEGQQKSSKPIVSANKQELSRQKSEIHRLSFLQENILSMNSRALGPTYNVPIVLDIKGKVDSLVLSGILNGALKHICDAFHTSGDASSVQVGGYGAYVSYRNYLNLSPTEAASISAKNILHDASIPVDYMQLPFRCTMYFIDVDHIVISLIFHHLVVDAIAIEKFLEHIGYLYTNQGEDIEKYFAKFQPYRKYIEMERNFFHENRHAITEFWKGHLSLCKLDIDIPFLNRRPNQCHYNGQRIKKELSEGVANRIEELCKAFEVKPLCFYLACFSMVIHILSRDSNFCVGVITSGRTKSDMLHVLGCATINHLFCPSESYLKSPFPKFLYDLNTWLQEASNMAFVPFSELLQMANVQKDHSCHFPQFMFNFHSKKAQVIDLGESVFSSVSFLPTYTCKCELLLDIESGKDTIIDLEYDSSLYNREIAEHIIDLIMQRIQCSIDICSGNYAESAHCYNLLEEHKRECTTFEHFEPNQHVEFDEREMAIFKDSQITGIDMQCSLHQLLYLHLPPTIKIQEIKECLRKLISEFYRLSLVVNFKEEYLEYRDQHSTFIIASEQLPNDEKCDSIIDREMCWPFDLSSGPLFRATLVSNENGFSSFILCCHKLLCDVPQMELIGMSAGRHLGLSLTSLQLYTTKFHPSSKKRRINTSFWNLRMNSLGSIALFDTLSESDVGRGLHCRTTVCDWGIKTDNYVILCSAFALLFSYYISCRAESGAEIALFVPISSDCREVLIPLGLNLDLSDTFGKLTSKIELEILEIMKNYVPFWKLQKDYYGKTSYVRPFIHTAVRFSSITTESIQLYCNLPFQVYIEFNLELKKIALSTNLATIQSNSLQVLFKKMVRLFSKLFAPETACTVSLREHFFGLGDSKLKCSQNLSVQSGNLTDLLVDRLSQDPYEIAYVEAHHPFVSTMTYGELNCQVAILQDTLQLVIENKASQLVIENKPIRDPVVAILTDGRTESPTAVLTCIVACIPFVVLDPREETYSLCEILQITEANLILFDHDNLEKAMEIADHNIDVQIIPIRLYREHTMKRVSNVAKRLTSTALDRERVFIVFTSGTTGKPKGVPVLRKSLHNFLSWHIQHFKTRDQVYCWLQYVGVSFDVYIAEIAGQVLLHNKMLLMSPHDHRKLESSSLMAIIKSFYVGGMHLISTVLKQLLGHHNFSTKYLPSLRHIACIGERLHSWQCEIFFQKFHPHGVMLHNWGGPSECTIAFAHCVLNTLGSMDVIPIGKNVYDSEVIIVKPNTSMVLPCGIPGEVLISGCPVFSGYLQYNMHESPFVSIDNKHWYRSGDLGFLNEQKELVLMNRLDRQVKVSGQRRELLGVENMIRNLHLPYLKNIIVEVCTSNKVDILVCFPLTKDPIKENTVQSDISRNLPERYTPTVVKCFTEYPYLLSGKVNRKKILEYHKVKKNATLSNRDGSMSVELSILMSCVSQLLPRSLHLEQAATLTLDSLGFSSIMKTSLHQMLLDRGFKISINVVLLSKSLEDLSLYLLDKGSVYRMEKVSNRLASSDTRNTLVVITTMEVRVPGAENLSEFWDMLCDKKEAISHDLPRNNSLLKRDVMGHYIGSRGIIKNKDSFDADLFGMSTQQAKLMDPQHRVLLETVWTALENAGCDPVRFKSRGKIGCFATVHFPTYLINTLQSYKETRDMHLDQVMFGCTRDNAALLVGRYFDFHGPCITVTDNCASFCVALHLARNSLQQAECDIAIVAGSTVAAHNTGYLFRDKDIYSSDGHCSPFSNTASGTVMSDGVVVLILKRADDAKKEGDNIYCIVKDTSVGSDGASMKTSTFAPSTSGQKENLLNLFSMSSTPPADISFVEAHGSGTRTGDQIELESLSEVFMHHEGWENKKCLLGSIKGNVGHLGVTAAGPGIVKAALALKKCMFPPTINFKRPTTYLAMSPFEITCSNAMLKKQTKPHTALVHSIGALGINGAVMLEEYKHEETEKGICDSNPKSELNPPSQLFPLCLSANSEFSLKQLCEKLSVIIKMGTIPLSDISFNLLAGRQFLPMRKARVFSINDTDNIIAWLMDTKSDTVHVKQFQSNNSVSILLSGQGAVFCKEYFCNLCQFNHIFRDNAKTCITFLKQKWPNEVGDLLSVMDPNHLTTALDKASILHCMVVITQIGMYKILAECGIEANLFCGHSLGEYTAAILSGALSTEDGLNIIFKRGLLLKQNSPSQYRMLALHCSGSNFEHLIDRPKENYNIEISCWNSPKHCVISGPFVHLKTVKSQLDAKGIQSKFLPIEYCFHHSCAKAVADELLQHLKKNTKTLPLKQSLITSLRGQCTLYNPGDILPLTYWTDHLTTAVDFYYSLSLLKQYSTDSNNILEIGIRPFLKSFVSASQPTLTCSSFTLKSAAKSQHNYTAIEMLTTLWRYGYNLALNKLDAFKNSRLVALPTYQFDHRKYWISGDEVQKSPPTNIVPATTQTQHNVSPRSVMEFFANQLGQHGGTVTDSVDQIFLYAMVFKTYQVSVFEQLKDKFTLERIADFIVQECNKQRRETTTVIVPHHFNYRDNSPNLFIVNAADGKEYSHHALSTLLSNHFSIYWLFHPSVISNAVSVKECAERYLQALQSVQPEGPYYIAGFSFGAWIAHAIAVVLEKVDTKVEVLIMLDPPCLQTLQHPNTSMLAVMIANGPQLMRKCINDSDYERIHQYERNSIHQTQLLAEYGKICTKIMCRTIVIIARERSRTDGSMANTDNWSNYCHSDNVSVEFVPGKHHTFISAFKSPNVYSIIATHLLLPQSSTLPLPVRSSSDIAMCWKLSEFFFTDKSEFSAEQSKMVCEHSFLKITPDDCYICSVPSLVCL